MSAAVRTGLLRMCSAPGWDTRIAGLAIALPLLYYLTRSNSVALARRPTAP